MKKLKITLTIDEHTPATLDLRQLNPNNDRQQDICLDNGTIIGTAKFVTSPSYSTPLEPNHVHNLQGAIEHFAKILIDQSLSKRIGERTLSEFDIKYYSEMLSALVSIRENIIKE